jgi:aminopeptidase N
MTLKNYVRSFLPLFLIALAAISISAQTSKSGFNRVRTYDVQHYILRVSFDRAGKTVFGDTTVQLKPLKGNFNQVELDAAAMKFDSVRLEPANKDLQYQQVGEKIIVTLDKIYAPNDLISLRFKYSAKPSKGVYFIDAETQDGKTIHDAQIWTQGEAEEAHFWFPSYDFPDDKATSEQYITVEKSETAIGNGEQLETLENADGTKTFHFKMPVPHSTYLTSFVVGNYTKVSDSYKNVPLGFYMYPGMEALAQSKYGKTKEMMRVYEELTGVAFPYNKYDQTMVSNFNFGGMENITATTMADTEIIFNPDNIVEDLVSHELAHSWFGNLVTCRNWAELWLNEGFATYMEAAYREKAYGREDYLRKIREDAAEFFANDAVNDNKHGLYNLLARPDDSIFDTTTYQKGGAVVHTLCETVGTESFWKAINIYLNRHKFQNVETSDLQKAMEEVSGKKLDWFFKQWIYGGGYPKLNVRQVYNNSSKTLNLTVSQKQTADKLTPVAFILPMEIEITTAKGTKTERIEIKKREETFSIKVDGKPTNITFDRSEKIPLKSIKTQPLTMAKGK